MLPSFSFLHFITLLPAMVLTRGLSLYTTASCCVSVQPSGLSYCHPQVCGLTDRATMAPIHPCLFCFSGIRAPLSTRGMARSSQETLFWLPSTTPPSIMILSSTAIHKAAGDFNIVSHLVMLIDIFSFQFLRSSMAKR